MVDDTNWVMLGADVKGDIYEGLLEKNAEDTKGVKANVLFFDNHAASKTKHLGLKPFGIMTIARISIIRSRKSR